MTDKPADWDPEPGEREWYRETSSGQLGYRVRRGGRDRIRLDRGSEEILRAFTPGEWSPEKERRPLMAFHLARVAFEADRALCSNIGLPENARKEWSSLSEDQKKAWLTVGPTKDPMRKRLYESIQAGMAEFKETR